MIYLNASSQETCLNLPSPFSPILIIGYFSLSGSYRACIPALPLGHNIFFDLGNMGLGSSLVTIPSSTLAIAAHLFTHISHSVGISFTSPASPVLVVTESGIALFVVSLLLPSPSLAKRLVTLTAVPPTTLIATVP